MTPNLPHDGASPDSSPDSAPASAPEPTFEMADLSSRSFISQRLKLHYVDWGNHGAPPLILLHGAQDHCRNWDWTARALRKDYHIIAPDLRGHGDSQWSPDGAYNLTAYTYDLAQLLHQLDLGPVTIVSHSLGGNIALRYAGLYPENVRKLVTIEGWGPPPWLAAKRLSKTMDERIREWIEEMRVFSSRAPRHYPSIEAARARMHTQNPHLSPAQAHHLTIHGVLQNEDGSFAWKFDNYTRNTFPVDVSVEQLHAMWGRITCPVLMLHGQESWAAHPEIDGLITHFQNARAISFERASHWLHHDRLDTFLHEVSLFLDGEEQPSAPRLV